MTRPGAPAGTGDPRAAGPRPRVLVADDEPATLALVADLLADAGYEVVRARDGLEALARLREGGVAVALLDVMMTGLDGREVCRRAIADPAFGGAPVILFSAADERDVDWRAAGAAAFLAKPFRLRDIVGLVARYAPGAADPAG